MQINDEFKAELVKLLQSLADKTQSRAEHAQVRKALDQLTNTEPKENTHEAPYF